MATRAGVPRGWLRAEAEAGRIPHLRAGERLLFRAELVERVGQLGQRCIWIGQGQHPEGAEPPGMIGDQARHVLIHLAGELDRERRVGEVHAWVRDRDDRARHPLALHHRQAVIDLPGRVVDVLDWIAQPGSSHRLPVERRDDVVVHVDRLRERRWRVSLAARVDGHLGHLIIQ